MNLPLLGKLAHLIEEILKSEVPIMEKAAVATAVGAAESDPKVQAITAASVALLSAAQNLKTAAQTPNAPHAAPVAPKPK